MSDQGHWHLLILRGISSYLWRLNSGSAVKLQIHFILRVWLNPANNNVTFAWPFNFARQPASSFRVRSHKEKLSWDSLPARNSTAAEWRANIKRHRIMTWILGTGTKNKEAEVEDTERNHRPVQFSNCSVRCYSLWGGLTWLLAD